METSENYFSTLSLDEIRKILYYTDELDHCSDGPEAVYRHAMLTSVRAADAENLASLFFSTEGPFRCVTHNMFTTVHLDYEQKLNTIISRGIIAFGHNEYAALLEPILETCGRYITEIHVRVATFDYHRVSVPLLLRLCKSVRKLRFSVAMSSARFPGSIVALLEGLSPQIKSIEFGDMFNSGPNVLELNRIVPAFGALKSFQYSHIQLHNLLPIFTDAGETLEEIDLTSRGQTLWSTLLRNIQRYCHRLSVVKLVAANADRFPLEVQVQFTSFLSSYGNQLRIADLSCLRTKSREEVMEECRNLRCVATESKNDFERVRILGSRLTELRLELDTYVEWEVLSSCIEKCSNLTALSVTNLTSPEAGSFLLPVEYLELRRLELTNVPSNVVFNLFAEKTPRLKVLHIDKIDIDEEAVGYVFREFADSIPDLEELSMTLYKKHRPGPLMLAIAKETLKCFSKRQLRRFYLDFNAKAPDKMRLRTICVPYRNRGTRYTLCFQYYWLEFN